MSLISRRTALRMIGVGAAAPAVLCGRYRIVAQSATQYSARAIHLVESSVLVDLLNQFQFADDAARSQANFSRYQYHEDTDGAINVKGLNHPKRMFDLTEGLIRRGYSDPQIAQILGGNAVRVLGTIWRRN